MADTKLSALTELAATPATDDELYIRDVSELAVDESKRITVANLVAAGAPTGADYLVGTTQAGLSAEIVVGTAPGGELGGTWASPTVDTIHSGSAHAGASALTRVGGNTTEATTTSLTEVSLITISSLSVGALVPILALGIWRKTDGAAASVSVGLMLNATAGYMSAISDAVDIVRNGAFEFYVGSRQTNYARPGWRLRNMAGTSDLVGTGDDVPLVTITDVIIRGLTGSASVTLAVDEIHVYTYAVS